MKRLFALAVTSALATVATAVAAGPTPTGSVTASDSKAGARPVAITIQMHYPMQCSNPGKSLSVTFPAAMTVPAEIPASAILVNDHRAASVSNHGTKVVVAIAEDHWIKCKTLGYGSLKVVIGKNAGLANPKTKGIYSVGIAVGFVKGAPQLRIT